MKSGILFLLLLCLSACGRQVVEFGTDDTGVVDRPMVVATQPLSAATDVAVGTTATARFNLAMDATTFDTSTFTVMQAGTSVLGVVTLKASTNTGSFQPSFALMPGLVYTAMVTTGAKSSAGLALTRNYTWNFTTADRVSQSFTVEAVAIGGTDPPTVISTLPADKATGVASTTPVSATFSEAVAPATISASTFTLKQGATKVTGVVTLDGVTNTASFAPAAPLTPGLVYTATLSTGVKGTNGVALAKQFSWAFTIAVAVPPTIVSTTPLDLATNVSINEQPSATFSTAMDPTTITTLTFVVKQGLNDVVGVVTFDAPTKTATFTPLVPLAVGLVYEATVTTGATALGGGALVADHSWTFTTGACSQAPVVLGAASSFVVLGGSTVTSTGLTAIVGDVGVSPGTAITGFPPGTIVGSLHAGDPTAAQGIADLTTAYNDAAGRTLCPVTVAGNLGGQTLAPGLYKSTASLAVSSGDLTLDAQGDGAAIFVFQMASTLTTTAGRQVILTNGAKAANVYWQVGTSATLGTTSVFQGTIMADQAITLDTGATLNGRALARIAAVNLDGNSIVKPLP